jgi:hypothetical protein
MLFKDKNKEKKDENVTDILEYKYKKLKKKSNKRRIIISGVIVFIALMLVIFRQSLTVYNAQNLVNNIGAAIRGENLKEFQFAYDAKNQYDFYREHLVVASSDGIRLYRPAQQGSTISLFSYPDIKVIANDIYVLAYDSSQSSYSIIEANKSY